MMADKPLAVLYEHLEWQRPLFDELDSRKVPYDKLYVGDLFYDPALRECPYALVVNRVSAYPSGSSHPQIVHFVSQYLAYLDSIGAKVVVDYLLDRVASRNEGEYSPQVRGVVAPSMSV